MAMIAKNRINSTWTPLSNEDTNNKIFEERRILIGKWFDKWSDDQRKKLFEHLLLKSKPSQLQYVREYVEEYVPAYKRDFTRYLPRVVSIYIFTFLDPRSLSRCAWVCHHWKSISELDELWMPKCLRRGWFLPYTPSLYEVGVWKRNYIENVKTLHLIRPKEKLQIDDVHSIKKTLKNMKKKTLPWRGSDPQPKDTWRFNYLENDDVVDNINKLRKKKTYGHEAEMIAKNARSKVKTGQNMHNQQVRRSQSLGKMNGEVDTSQIWDVSRPTSAAPKSVTYDKNLVTVSRPNTVTSAQVTSVSRPAGSRPVSSRTPRDPPSSPLFPHQPWKIPDKEDSDDDV
ncbi:hypothetical protein CHS0354_016959 [Potamilus streckersoni]|uniref:F-box domain-containing protein n=1 Tax=Potamilus streckersoni TaxID=2493646 RepID=A0AAE0VQT2_9BIVA|nr:hypothetical protein CHS0354_016959 [Potamilus streckersoni]